MRQSTIRILPLVLATGLFLGHGVHAAQLGKLEVLSSATEPFLAQIQVDAVKPEQRKGLQAKLASAEAFKAARLQMDPRLTSFKFEVKEGPTAETALIRISSDKPVAAGFLDALVELSWAGGKVAREYTINVAEGKTAGKPAPVPAPLPDITAPQTAVAPAPSQAAAAAPADGLGTEGSRVVKKGQTLSELALGLTSKDVSLNQAMAAIYEANRDAFIKNSVHLIREGAQIRIPNKAALRARNANEALLVLAQNDGREVYSRYARQIGLSTVADQSKSVPSTQASGKIDAKPVQTAPEGQAADRLKIAPSTASNAKADAAAEELTAKNKALAEANERIALLEKNVSDLQKLLDMQKDLVSNPTEPVAAPAAAPQAAAEPPKEPVAADAPVAPVVEVPSESLSKADDLKKPDEKPLAAAPPADEETVSSLVPWLLGGAGGVVLLVIALLIWKARSGARKETGFEDREPDFENVIPEDGFKAEDTVKAQVKSEQALKAVANDDFDLDELLSTPEDTQVTKAPSPSPEAVQEPVIDEPIPELPSESAEAASQTESLRSDVTLDFPEESLETKVEKPAHSILDDLDFLEKGAQSAQEELQALRENPPVATDVDFDDDELPDNAQLAAQTAAQEPASQVPEEVSDAFDKALADIDLDVADPAPADTAKPDDATWQEVATKLDLAGAYVEIGDADGAKELLNEIMKKGDAEQVSKAKALLATLR